MIPLKVGMTAPDFNATDHRGDAFALSQSMRGSPVLLIFYPANWGFICRNEIVEFRDRHNDYRSLGIKLLGISTNMAISHGLWSEQLCLPFPLISDPPGNIAAAYGVLDQDEESFNKGRAQRALFLLDGEMTVRFVWLAKNPWLEPDYDEILIACQSVLESKCSSPPMINGRVCSTSSL